MDNVKRSGKSKHHQDRFGLGSIARKGHAATCRAKNQIGFLLFSFRASVDKANGPMSGPHPYTDGVSLTSPTPQSCTATAKTTGTTDLSAWPTLRAVDRPNVTVKRALAPCGVGEVNPKGHRSGFPGLSYDWKGNGTDSVR